MGRFARRVSPRRLVHGGKRRIGLYGGSFDPVHPGHWHCAERLRKALKLHQVWWMVAVENPLKHGVSTSTRSDYAARCTHLSAFLRGGNIRHRVVEYHLHCGSMYTIDALRYLIRRRRHHYFWLGGSDLLPEWSQWRAWQLLPRYARLCIYNRPGAERGALRRARVYRYVRGPKSVLASRELRKLFRSRPSAFGGQFNIRYHDYTARQAACLRAAKPACPACDQSPCP